MKISRVTVFEGNAHVEIEGLDVPIVVTEGKTLRLSEHTLTFEWNEGTESQVIAATKPG